MKSIISIIQIILLIIQVISVIIKAVLVSNESKNEKLIIACDIVCYSCCAIIMILWVVSLTMPIP